MDPAVANVGVIRLVIKHLARSAPQPQSEAVPHLGANATVEISYTEEGSSSSTFATLLRRYRRRARMTQEGLAERAHLSRGAVSSLERGERLAPRKETVALLATALELADADRSALLEAARHRHNRPHQTGGRTPLIFPVVQPVPISPWFSTLVYLRRQHRLLAAKMKWPTQAP